VIQHGLHSVSKSRIDCANKGDRNLDLLRTAAVLVVLVAHCLPKSPPQQAAGHYGVLMFFVHTALVLLLSLKRQMGAPGLTVRFYMQRVFRVYPLSVLCVLVTLAFRISWPDAVYTPRSGVSIMANLLLVQNFLHERVSISPPLWSLPFELQMYAVLPAVFWILRKRGMFGAVCLAAGSMALATIEALTNPFGGLFVTRFIPCFIGGAFAYCMYNWKRRLYWWLWPVVIASLGLFYGINAQIQTVPGDWATCTALGLLVPMFREVPRGLLSKAAVLVARYSYGIYLSHAPLLWLCFQRLAILPAAIRWAVFGALICITPVVLYHLIEEPTIRVGKALSFRMFPIDEVDTQASAKHSLAAS